MLKEIDPLAPAQYKTSLLSQYLILQRQIAEQRREERVFADGERI